MSVRNAVSKSKATMWIVLGVVLVSGIAGVGYWLVSREPETTVSLPNLREQASALENEERHEEVVRLLFPHLADIRNDADLLAQFALAQLQVPLNDDRHVELAMSALLRLGELQPNDATAFRYLHELNARLNRSDDAIANGARALKLDPENLQLCLSLLDVYLVADKCNEARELASKQLESFPNSLELHERLLEATTRLKLPTQPMLDELAETTPEIARTYLTAIVAQHQGDEVLLETVLPNLAAERPDDPAQQLWLTAFLERNGRAQEALALREETQVGDISLVARWYQRGDYEKIINAIDRSSDGTSDVETMIVKAMAALQIGKADAVVATIAEIEAEPSSLLSRVWVPVLRILSAETLDAKSLWKSCDAALKSYPQNCYLLYYRGVAQSILCEDDAALESFRDASRLASRWHAARLEIARLCLRRGSFANAVQEAAVALRINPSNTQPLDILIGAIPPLRGTGELTQPIRDAMLATLGSVDVGEDAVAKQLLLLIDLLLREEVQELTDNLERIANDSQLDFTARQFRLLQELTSDEALGERLAARAEANFGPTLDSIAKQADVVYRRDGLEATLQYFRDSQTSDGAPVAPVVVSLATAQFLTSIEHETASQAWMRVAEEGRDSARLLQLVLERDELSSEQKNSVRKSLIELTGENGVVARLAAIQARFERGIDEAEAARTVVELRKLIADAPTSLFAYGLLAIAHDKLEQHDKALEALLNAKRIGISTPGLHLQLAERLQKAGRIDEAADEAAIAGQLSNATFNIRQRAVGVLLAAKRYAVAAQLLRADLASQPTDSDQDFTLYSTYLSAVAKAGEVEKPSPGVRQLASQHDRWFRLWLSTALDVDDPDVAAERLQMSERWVFDQETPTRRRQLANAWGRAAELFGDDSMKKNAVRVFVPVVRESGEPSDYLRIAQLILQSGNSEKAMQVYRKFASTDHPAALRATAMNNLASLLLEQGDLADAELNARNAVAITAQPAFLDTLVSIVCLQRDAAALESIWAEHKEVLADETTVEIAELLVAEHQLHEVAGILEHVTNSDPQSYAVQLRMKELRKNYESILAASN